jgi:hypothetical protein
MGAIFALFIFFIFGRTILPTLQSSGSTDLTIVFTLMFYISIFVIVLALISKFLELIGVKF